MKVLLWILAAPFILFALLKMVPEPPDDLPKAFPGTSTIENYMDWKSICEFGQMGARMTAGQYSICRKEFPKVFHR